MLPDRMHGREPRSIIWDDQAGTVAGEHSAVSALHEIIQTPRVDLSSEARRLILRDPAHSPADFLSLPGVVWWPVLRANRDRNLLPAALREVEATNAQASWDDLLMDPEHPLEQTGIQAEALAGIPE